MTDKPIDRQGADRMGFANTAFLADPYPFLTQLRSMGSVVPVSNTGEHTVWLVTKFYEAVQVLKDQRFSVDRTNRGGIFGGQYRKMASQGFILDASMISVDEPSHSRLRNLVSKAFTPGYIESLRPMIQRLADELLDRVQAQGKMDLVDDYAFPLPINVISEMLGIPQEDRAQIRVWSAVIATPGDDPQAEAKLKAFSDYVKKLVADKRLHPQDDLVSKLVHLEEAGDRLNADELLSMVALLIFAGHETTSNLIGNGALALLDNPAQLEQLKTDPSLIPEAVEELLRFCGPVISPAPRYALQDIQVGGQNIRSGDVVMVMIASADRDEDQFDDPQELNVARALNRHIAFGQGIHYCLGAPLARLEGEIAFTSLLRRMPDLRLDAPRADIHYRASMVLRGVASLPVAF